MARILFVNQYYWPDFASTGQHLTDLAEHLVAAGHEVRVLTSRGRYLEGKGEAPVSEVHNGVRIRRVRATSLGKRRTLGRLTDYLSFHVLAGARILFSGWADVVVTLTTPPLIGVWGALVSRFRRAKHVCFVMDLHPDAEFELGMLSRDSILGRFLELMNAWPLRTADANVVLGPYQASRIIKKDVEPQRIREIPIWSDKREIAPVEHADNPLRGELGWSERFVVMYSGNAGLVHCFDELIEAASILRDEVPEVLFAFVGGGPRTPEIRAAVEERGLDNVEFHPYFPRAELARSLSSADVHFLSLRPEQTGVAVPGKLYGCLAAGRPVLFVGGRLCESADAVRDSGAGHAFEVGAGPELAARIRALQADPETCAEMGRRARDWFLAYHERELSCEKWRELLERVAPAGVPQPSAPVAGVRASAPAVDAVPAIRPSRDGAPRELAGDGPSKPDEKVESRKEASA